MIPVSPFDLSRDLLESMLEELPDFLGFPEIGVPIGIAAARTGKKLKVGHLFDPNSHSHFAPFCCIDNFGTF